jgi:hypothetical protein
MAHKEIKIIIINKKTAETAWLQKKIIVSQFLEKLGFGMLGCIRGFGWLNIYPWL